MTTLIVEKITFTFPPDWLASKYDDWAFYRDKFSRQGPGIAAVDLVAASPSREAFLIEVKDYRHPGAEKPSDLPASIVNKVICTLAALLPASIYSTNEERTLSRRLLRCKSLKVVVHIEQPRSHRQVVDPADIKQKLKSRLRAVDPHLKVTSMADMRGMPWTVA